MRSIVHAVVVTSVAVALGLSAQATGAPAAAAPATTDQARADAIAYLAAQLGDRALARDLGPLLFDASFTWPEPAPTDRAAALKTALDRVSALAAEGSATPPATPTTPVPARQRRAPHAARVRAAAVEHLAGELGNPELARDIGPTLFDASLTWLPRTVPVAKMDTIVAYAFGNRVGADGTPTPGPMNEQLAATVHRLAQRRRGIPVYAQWEIAHILRDEYGMKDVISIEPDTAADGSTVYLSTNGVARKVVALAGDPAKLGQVGVVAWRDHVRRSVGASVAAGMRAAAPAGVTMPVRYDPESGQPWTRTRRAYVIHDVQARLIDAATVSPGP